MSDTVTETIDPAASLTDPLAGVVPSTVTAPAANNAPTSDRERPVTIATTRSSRWPSRAAGTSSS